MAVTILEALINAEMNTKNLGKLPLSVLQGLIENQIHNAWVLLERGYPIDTEVEPLLEQYGEAENVPDYEEGNDGT